MRPGVRALRVSITLSPCTSWSLRHLESALLISVSTTFVDDSC